LNEWVDEGVFQKAWARILRRLDGLGEIDWDIRLWDATFSPAKKGALQWEKPNAARAAS
jgi:hypothetical protein